MKMMALVLVREAFFWEKVMIQCIAQGHKELMKLKDELRRLLEQSLHF